jgi:hypothetical protein
MIHTALYITPLGTEARPIERRMIKYKSINEACVTLRFSEEAIRARINAIIGDDKRTLIYRSKGRGYEISLDPPEPWHPSKMEGETGPHKRLIVPPYGELAHDIEDLKSHDRQADKDDAEQDARILALELWKEKLCKRLGFACEEE